MSDQPPMGPYGAGPEPGPQAGGPPQSTPPPGWYPVPEGQRWWDGTTWTGHLVARGSSPASDDNTIAMVAHLGGAFGSVLVPILILMLRKDMSPYVRHHANEAINFHISVFIYLMVSLILVFVIIGFFLMFAVMIGFWILSIVASVAAYQGTWYRYPLTIHFLK